mmetsp:Transcript_21036/g.68175  ORF Transcript_21036/g.68175 Transcript_21036/m.68175 type:complete len:216 (+) Transcript_21036:984-1631(+)
MGVLRIASRGCGPRRPCAECSAHVARHVLRADLACRRRRLGLQPLQQSDRQRRAQVRPVLCRRARHVPVGPLAAVGRVVRASLAGRPHCRLRFLPQLDALHRIGSTQERSRLTAGGAQQALNGGRLLRECTAVQRIASSRAHSVPLAAGASACTMRASCICLTLRVVSVLALNSGRQSLVMVRRCRVVSRRSRRRGSRQYTVADSRQLSGSGLRS